MPGRRITVQGRVQGVGFRPHVWRLAHDVGLRGHVLNDGNGVSIEVWGDPTVLDRFQQDLTQAPPPLSQITHISVTALTGAATCADFVISNSRGGVIATQITPDAATCPACLAEVFDPANRRFGYPFTNCTHCGPRLSIVRGVPYDRAQTSMHAFTMCADCQSEYDDPANRRFHAQPNACLACGPKLWLEDAQGYVPRADPLQEVAHRLRQGQIIAIKGIGGFHLACDATNADAVQALRVRKHRAAKPFAIMAKDCNQIGTYCHLLDAEADLLAAPAAPIVLLEKRQKVRLPGIAPHLDRIGVMLPHTPLHHLLMQDVAAPLVMTSGNPAGAPQVTDNDQARHRLDGIADAWLMHDRAIVNRLDDSLVRVDAIGPAILRRSRGMAPAPIPLPAGFADLPPTLAMGADIKSAFCLLTHGQAIPSPHIGDLAKGDTYADFRTKIALFCDLYDFTPQRIAVDGHPNYLSTRYGERRARETGTKLVRIQHHYAHMVSCLAEHQIPVDDGLSVGVILDGAGFGTDGTIWGGEILLGDYQGFTRKAHFRPVALPGGDQAAKEPWRNLVAHLQAAFGDAWPQHIAGTPLAQRLEGKPTALICQMIAQGLNAPLASSAGRLFDAVAAALGIAFDQQHYEGQAAMALEALIDQSVPSHGYPAAVSQRGEISWAPLWAALIADLKAGVGHGTIAMRFHTGLAAVLAQNAMQIATDNGTQRIVLSGGVMQNRNLRTQLAQTLRKRGYDVLCHKDLPANDGGIALGQAVIAAQTRD